MDRGSANVSNYCVQMFDFTDWLYILLLPVHKRSQMIFCISKRTFWGMPPIFLVPPPLTVIMTTLLMLNTQGIWSTQAVWINSTHGIWSI